jgi:hypothetical protein
VFLVCGQLASLSLLDVVVGPLEYCYVELGCASRAVQFGIVHLPIGVRSKGALGVMVVVFANGILAAST